MIIKSFRWSFCGQTHHLSGGISAIWFIFWCLLVYDDPACHPRISKEERDYIHRAIRSVHTEKVRLGRMGRFLFSFPLICIILRLGKWWQPYAYNSPSTHQIFRETSWAHNLSGNSRDDFWNSFFKKLSRFNTKTSLADVNYWGYHESVLLASKSCQLNNSPIWIGGVHL